MLEVYKVLVALAIKDGVSRGLLGLSRRFSATTKEAALLEQRINKIKTSMLAGVGMAFAGALGLRELTKMLGPAEEYAHTIARANAMGVKHKEIVEGIGAAWKASEKSQTTSVNQALEMLLNLRYSLGSMQRAIQILPLAAQFKTAYTLAQGEGAVGQGVASPVAMVYSATKSAEMLSKTRSMPEFKKYMIDMMRMAIGTSGMVTPIMRHQTAKYARGAGPYLSDAFLFGVLPGLEQEMKVSAGAGAGGARGGPGAMLAAFYRMIIQGVMSKKLQGKWASLGLITGAASQITAADRAKYENMYKQLVLHPMKAAPQTASLLGTLPIKGRELARTNPYLWTQEILLPLLKKAYPGATTMELGQKATELATGNQLTAQMLSYFIVSSYRIEKNKRMLADVLSKAGIMGVAKQDPRVGTAAVAAQWENVKLMLGKSFMFFIVPALFKFAKALGLIADVFREFPELGKETMIALYGLAGALTFSGIVMILRGAFLGLQVVLEGVGFATGIGEITVALAGLYEIVMHWHTLYKDITGGLKGAYYLIRHPLATAKYVGTRGISGVAYDMLSGYVGAGVHVRPHTAHREETHIIMDGKKVGKLVAKHIGSQMASVANAHSPSSGFDPSLNMPGVAYNF